MLDGCVCAFYNINYVHGRHDERMNKAKGYMEWDNGMVRKEQRRAERLRREKQKLLTLIVMVVLNQWTKSSTSTFLPSAEAHLK